MAAAYTLHTSVASEGGTFSFTGSAVGCEGTNGSFPYPANKNCQIAIGAHSI